MDKLSDYATAFGKSLTTGFEHWPGFFGMAGLDWLRVKALDMISLQGSLGMVAETGIQGYFDIAKMNYYQQIQTIK